MSAESQKSQIQLTDVQRLLMGKAPFAFLAETALRCLLMYLLLTLVMRLMGKRMGGQISNLELAVMMMLGAVISLPIQSLDAGMLPAAAVLLMLLGMQRALSVAGAYSQRIEELTQGKPSILVRDGVVLLSALEDARVSRRQLFSTLRSRGVRHLGEVKRVYLESGGVISVLRMKNGQPGLSVLPAGDADVQAGATAVDGPRVCCACGTVVENLTRTCPVCHAARWTTPVRSDS